MGNTKLHLALDVTDLEGAVAFYSTLFDMTPTKREAGYVQFDADAPPVVLALNEAGRSGLSHMGVRVDGSDAVQRERTRFQAAGLPVAIEDDVQCCYALQDKVWAHDPGGLPWEVYTVKAPSNVRRDSSTECCPTSDGPSASCCS